MKTTKILLAAIALFIITSSSVFAQDGRFSVGAELALPMGTFGDAYSIGIGGSVRYEMPMGDNLGLLGTVGFISLSGKTPDNAPDDYDAPSQTMIPIQIGAKYYFVEQQNGFYGSAQLGVHMSSYTVPGYDAVMFGNTVLIPAKEEETVTNTNFSFAPGLGYALANLDFGLRYQIISGDGGSSSYLGVRVAYQFGGK